MTVATYAAAQVLRVLPRTSITRAVGRLCDAHLPTPLVNAAVGLYVRAYRVNLDESVRPEGSFPSFDAFFTRPLREGARPILGSPEALVSPADGRLDDFGPITAGGRLTIKGRDYAVADLVGDPAEVARYEGGQYAIVYLSPRDYHRVHSPAAGKLVCVRSMPGDYYPVNSIGLDHVPNLFVRNRRVALAIDTEAHGRVTVVMVAAMVVGRITVTGIDERDVPYGTFDVSVDLARGAELGMVHLGSTAVVFFEKKGFSRFVAKEGPVLMGQALAEGSA